jgi:hypothetical protein
MMVMRVMKIDGFTLQRFLPALQNRQQAGAVNGLIGQAYTRQTAKGGQ